MKIISLVDNKRLPQRQDIRPESGLALCIYTQGQQILFDTGISGVFVANAQRLNVDIAQVSLAVLSHHHFDHGGGLATFLAANSRAKIFLRSSTGTAYLHLFGVIKRRVGLDENLFEKYPQRFTFIDQFAEIAPDVFILTKIGKRHPTPKGNRYLFIHNGRTSRLDDFEHELILVVRENGGLVVFTGCSHHGILNMLDAVREAFPGEGIKAVIGGFHQIGNPLFNSMAGSRADIQELGQAIQGYQIEHIYTGHCTGSKAFRILHENMGEKIEYFAAGSQIET
jgi:7,8-dihydropterin-6-yl-methyl-4-(beta-D-ribofuranosyl)aminobenzene 5'-phosphate synthase